MKEKIVPTKKKPRLRPQTTEQKLRVCIQFLKANLATGIEESAWCTLNGLNPTTTTKWLRSTGLPTGGICRDWRGMPKKELRKRIKELCAQLRAGRLKQPKPRPRLIRKPPSEEMILASMTIVQDHVARVMRLLNSSGKLIRVK